MLEGIIKRLKAEIKEIEAEITEEWDSMTEEQQNKILDRLSDRYSLLRQLEEG